MPHKYKMTENMLKILKGRFKVQELLYSRNGCGKPIRPGQWVISLSAGAQRTYYRIYHEPCFPQV